MLVHLSVEDLGLIERIEFDPGQGLHVLTGETGVGKSMLLASMQMLRGERTRTDMIRRGADRASVRGIFFLHETLAAKVGEILGYPIEDGELIVEREISREGRSRCRIDGRESTAKVLRSIAPLLIEVVGQGQALTLLRSETQLELLDRFGGLVPQRQAHAQAWQEARELEERIHSLEENHRERRDRALFLEHVIHELDEARLEQGERTALEQELELLEERDRVLATISKARERILENDGGVLDTLGVTERDLQGFEALHPGIASLREASLHSRTLLEEAMREVSALESDLDIDPVALDRKRRRLDAIVSLEEKFHRSEENLIHYLDECREELSKISGDSEELPELRDGLDRCIQSLLSGAETLSRARLKVIERLAGDCASELQDLGLEKATLTGRLEPGSVEPLPGSMCMQAPETLCVPFRENRMSCCVVSVSNANANWSESNSVTSKVTGYLWKGTSECGTWSHAVISSLGARARGGVGRAPAFRVARCQTWTQVSHPRCPSTQDFGNHTVTFQIDHTPLHRNAAQFEWGEPIGELQ